METDGTRIRGSSWPNLIKKVADYRRLNGLPAGDPETEIYRQTCQRVPTLCFESEPTMPKPRTEKQHKESLKAALLRSMSETARRVEKNEVIFVPDALAAARADVCRRCPMQIDVGGGCGSCKQAIKGLAKQIRGKHPELPGVGCSIFQIHTPSQAYLDDPGVRRGDLPSECWRKVT